MKKLPNGGNPNLVGQYIDALKIFWVNDGSIVFLNDNEPFVYESTIFLKMLNFLEKFLKQKFVLEENMKVKAL